MKHHSQKIGVDNKLSICDSAGWFGGILLVRRFAGLWRQWKTEAADDIRGVSIWTGDTRQGEVRFSL